MKTNGTSVINHTVVAEPDLLANNISTLYVQALVQRLRQDEGETGLEVGQNVGQIISGMEFTKCYRHPITEKRT